MSRCLRIKQKLHTHTSHSVALRALARGSSRDSLTDIGSAPLSLPAAASTEAADAAAASSSGDDVSVFEELGDGGSNALAIGVTEELFGAIIQISFSPRLRLVKGDEPTDVSVSYGQYIV